MERDISSLTLLDEPGKRKQAVFKAPNRLGIAFTKKRHSGKSQIVAYITTG